VTVNGTALDVPPPGVGLNTVTEAVLAAATFVAGTVACTLLDVTKVVVRPTPFHFTTDVGTNPAPLTVSVKLGEPGATLVGRL
jgi:hypothetical protein